MNSDLEYAKSSLQELFYVLDLNMEADKVRALAEVADIITAIPARVEILYERATQEGYQVTNICNSENSFGSVRSSRNLQAMIVSALHKFI